MKKRVVLFVCTGNIFRSLSAERLLIKYIQENNIVRYEVHSAGTVAKIEPVDTKTKESLKRHGIDVSDHKQTKLSKELLEKCDVVIAMADYHINFMKNEFNYNKAVLFNELANGKKENVDDVNDVIKDYLSNRSKTESHIKLTVDYISKNISRVFGKIEERFFLFEDFAQKKNSKHKNGFPRTLLYESKNVMAFMSIDIPYKTDGHILVVPKKRYITLDEIPKNIKAEIIEVVGKIGEALKKEHGGYNILLNEGTDAGQYIFHTHFHIIPRNQNDSIKIEVWKHRRISQKEFREMNDRIKNLIKG